ncbi:MAG: flavodoxin [Kiritimatiellae bacterium]|nr:flavodoxin [Kiritimatiellia bacterium]
MKLILTLAVAVAVILACAVAGCKIFGRRDTKATIPLTVNPHGKMAIVYYSQSQVQNTALIAKWIQKQVGGDLFPLEMVEPYPEPYRETLKIAGKHHEEGTRPQLKGIPDLAGYDIVFLGSPIWYGTYAPPVATFLGACKLSGKTLAPFCTHGGGGAGHFLADVRKTCPDAKVLDGLTIRGSNQIERRLGMGVTSHHTEDDVVEWLNRIFK